MVITFNIIMIWQRPHSDNKDCRNGNNFSPKRTMMVCGEVDGGQRDSRLLFIGARPGHV